MKTIMGTEIINLKSRKYNKRMHYLSLIYAYGL